MDVEKFELDEKFRKVMEDVEWLNFVYDEIQSKYGGKFIAIKDKKIIRDSSSLDDLLDYLEAKGEDLERITIEYVPPRGLILVL